MVRELNTERIGIVGAGIIGIALARALAQRGRGEVTVLEKERRVAVHQTGHNSGVVHAGLYYPQGTLKSRLCAIGRTTIRDYCLERNLPYREAGKLVVALDDSELDGLAEIERRALASGVPGLRRVDAAGIRELEPHARGVAALHSPHTAVVDYAAITEAMAEDLRAAGGRVLLGTEVTAIEVDGGKARVTAGGAEHVFDRAIVCGGLQSDLLATMAGAPKSPKILPFRGEYWSLAADRAGLVNGMIYPVPDPRFPFLGVHFTRGVYGDVHVGPNAVPALAREGYTWRRVSAKDMWESLRWPGAPSLARRHWTMGLDEIAGSLVKRVYYERARRFIPELRMHDLAERAAAGVRAQAWAADGSFIDDFAVDAVGPVTLLRNAPSPAATSSMAIADYVISTYL